MDLLTQTEKKRKKIKLLLLIASLLLPIFSGTASGFAINYRVRTKNQSIMVSGIIKNLTQRTELRLRNEIIDYNCSKELECDKKGGSILIENESQNRGKISYQPTAKVENVYDNPGYLSSLESNYGVFQEKHIFLSNKELERFEAKFELPKNWKLVSPIKKDTNEISEKSIGERYLAFGQFETFKSQEGKVEVTLASTVNNSKRLNNALKFSKHFNRKFRKNNSFELIIIEAPLLKGGTAKNKSILIHPEASSYVLSHEIAHKFLDIKIEREARWFKESIINYYSIKSMRELGFWSEDKESDYFENGQKELKKLNFPLKNAWDLSQNRKNWDYYKKTGTSGMGLVSLMEKSGENDSLNRIIARLKERGNKEKVSNSIIWDVVRQEGNQKTARLYRKYARGEKGRSIFGAAIEQIKTIFSKISSILQL